MKLFALLVVIFFILVSIGNLTSKPAVISESEESFVENALLPSSTPQYSVLGESTINQESAQVIAVIDGDTIEVNIRGSIKRVRYIGINTPESVDPRQPVQCFSKEASQKNKELVEGKTVFLEKDISETDKYGRLLRYVYVGENFVNLTLVSEGYAQASSYPPDVRYQQLFKEAEQKARTMGVGIWGLSCATPITSVNETSVNDSICKYSCVSPDKDCSDFARHEEAQTYFTCCGFTSSNDPMKLDNIGVGDGIACENI